MASEKRLRLLSVSASGSTVKLGAALNAQNPGYSDTITLNGTLTYADNIPVTIGADEYMAGVIDPDTTQAEEVWLTTTPSGSPPTAMIIRGAGSSNGVPAHSSGATVVFGPTPYDRLLSFDDPWGGNLGYDYEFGGDGTALPDYSFNGSPVSWSTPSAFASATSYSEAWGKGVVSTTGSGSWGNWAVAVMPYPTGTTWTAYAKLALTCGVGADYMGGMFLYDSATGKFMVVGPRFNGSAMEMSLWGSTTSYSGNEASNNPSQFNPFYVKCAHTASALGISVSVDGVTWFPLNASYAPSGWSPDHIGFGCGTDNSNFVAASCQFFRVR